MTAINWFHLENNTMIALATDTKVVLGDRDTAGRIRNFHQKIFPLPHLHSVMCGTGSDKLVLGWYSFIQSQIIGRNIGILIEAAQRFLPELQEAAGAAVAAIGTTIYHIGFDESGVLRGYAHRSDNGFAPEEIPPSFIMKPGMLELQQMFIDVALQGGLVAAFVELIKRQRATKADDPAERQGIGGEVHFFAMSYRTQSLWNCYRFDDYDEEYAQILQWAKECDDARK